LESELTQTGQQVNSLDESRQALQARLDDAAARAQARVDSTLAVRDDIASQLAGAGITSAAVSSVEDDSAVAITLGSGDLYGVGSASLSKTGTELLGGVGEIVAGYPEWRVDVEGHTDSQGIGAVLREKYPTNWELSTARASAAVRYLSSRTGIDPEKISARGFADTQPVASNESSSGREQNRRVEIILRR
ncbi:MAG: OmpA family protein, partial [Pseudomonadota bacterium]